MIKRVKQMEGKKMRLASSKRQYDGGKRMMLISILLTVVMGISLANEMNLPIRFTINHQASSPTFNQANGTYTISDGRDGWMGKVFQIGTIQNPGGGAFKIRLENDDYLGVVGVFSESNAFQTIDLLQAPPYGSIRRRISGRIGIKMGDDSNCQIPNPLKKDWGPGYRCMLPINNITGQSSFGKFMDIPQTGLTELPLCIKGYSVPAHMDLADITFEADLMISMQPVPSES
jgi:hypothetical protein